MHVTNYSETELKYRAIVFGSGGSLTPCEAAGWPGKAASDSRLLPRVIFGRLCITIQAESSSIREYFIQTVRDLFEHVIQCFSKLNKSVKDIFTKFSQQMYLAFVGAI